MDDKLKSEEIYMNSLNYRVRSSHQTSKGSTTLISLLVMFALMSLGLLSLRFTHQDMSSAGNLRQSKQARYVAELGLHHAITLMQQQGNYLLRTRQGPEYLVIKSNGDVDFYKRNAAGDTIKQRTIQLPIFPALTEGPKPLGLIQNRIPSYEIKVEGFSAGTAPAGQELSQSDLGTPRQHFCLMHFSARGFITEQSLSQLNREDMNEEEWRRSLDLVAEHRLKSAITLGPFLISSCAL
jgi:hypothetical protein